MRGRCKDPTRRNYGARGISVCAEWQLFDNFLAWAMANGYDDALEIDRKDNDGNYGPDNCHFVTRKANLLNRRPSQRRKLT